MEQYTPADGWRAALAAASAGYAPEPPRPLAPGDPGTVGPYRIEAVLGQGGMGRVFLARDTRDERAGPAAVKVLARTGDATAWSRFRRELTAARRVQGNGTARVLDGDGDAQADPPWLAVEYIAGPTLDRLVAERGPISAAGGAGLAVGVAGALGAIHAAGVVHRDLKPANIILGADGPRVVDFGIARTLDATTLSVTGWTMGTPGYMAPEQITDPRTVGPEADVFALGAVLAFATTGASPYHGGDPTSVVYRIVHGEPQLSGVPASLRPLIEACLARDPAARPRVEAVAAAGLRIVEYEAARAAELAREQAGQVEPLARTAPPRPTPEPPQLSLPPAAPQSVPQSIPQRLPSPTPHSTPASIAQSVLPVFEYQSSPPPSPVPFPTRTTAQRTPHAPRVRAARIRRRPLALLLALVLALCGLTGWFAARALAHPSSDAGAAATGTTTTRTTTTGSLGARGGLAVFAGGVVRAGPGCPNTPWSVFSITSASLEKRVGGGDPACGGAADAFRKSGADASSGSRAEWLFLFHRGVRCTLSIYVANTDPSSGRAVYQVTVHGVTTTFSVGQAAFKGAAATPAAVTGLTAPDGVVELVLTDLSAKPGDTDHVTASSVAASCLPT